MQTSDKRQRIVYPKGPKYECPLRADMGPSRSPFSLSLSYPLILSLFVPFGSLALSRFLFSIVLSGSLSLSLSPSFSVSLPPVYTSWETTNKNLLFTLLL